MTTQTIPTVQEIKTAIQTGMKNYNNNFQSCCGRAYVCISTYGSVDDLFSKDPAVKKANKAHAKKITKLISDDASELRMIYQAKGYQVTNALYIGYDNADGKANPTPIQSLSASSFFTSKSVYAFLIRSFGALSNNS